MTIQPLNTIHSYHAHIYFAGPEQRNIAEALREQIAERFHVLIGRWHDQLIGPHTRPMYQVAFPTSELPTIVPWLMLNRCGLAVLIHPNTGHPRRDHLTNALWLGEMLDIDVTSLPELEAKPEAAIISNTNPTVTP
jgi:aromatic ring-cleaving dioxygenase